MSTPRLILGIDEAGRGPVVGDMFVACVAIEPSDLPKLRACGARDSKSMDRARRERVFQSILSIARAVAVVRATPQEIDSRNLNELFLEKACRAVKLVAARAMPNYVEVYVDAAGDPARATRRISEALRGLGIEARVVAEHGADAKYPIVGAASIVAKVLRDWHIDSLKRVYGDFGSGYPSDPRTREWLERVVRSGSIPPIVRRSWATFRRIAARSLLDYAKR